VFFLSDLTFIEDGNKDYLRVEDGRTDIINFEKMRKVATVIQQVKIYQQMPYNFEKVDIIYNFLENGLTFLSEEECYAKSREIEPPQ